MKAENTISLGTALFGAILTSGRMQAPAILRELAKTGNVDAFIELEGSGLIDAKLWDTEYSHQYDMAYSVLPLVEAAQPQQKAAASQFVEDWLTKFRGNDLNYATRHLRSCTDGAVVKAMTTRWGRELDASGILSSLVDAKISDDQPAQAILGLLQASSELGLPEPLDTALLLLARGLTYQSPNEIIKEMARLCAPFAGLADFGRQAVTTVIARSASLEEKGDLARSHTLQTWFVVLRAANTTPQQWRDVATSWSGDGAPFAVMAYKSMPIRPSERTLERMMEAGVSLNDLSAKAHDRATERPLLHQAVMEENVKLATFLLEQGADPTLQFTANGQQLTAFDVPKEGSVMAAILNAWKAKTAFTNAIGQARKNPN